MQKSILESFCQEPYRYCCKSATENKIIKMVYDSSGKSENMTVFNRFEEPPVPYGIRILITVFHKTSAPVLILSQMHRLCILPSN